MVKHLLQSPADVIHSVDFIYISTVQNRMKKESKARKGNKHTLHINPLRREEETHSTNSNMIWASSRENLSSGFPSKLVSNRPHQLQRLARKL